MNLTELIVIVIAAASFTGTINEIIEANIKRKK